MKKKLPNITSKLWSVSAILSVLILWQLSISFRLVGGFMLPSPVQVASTLMKEFPSLMESTRITLVEAGLGLALGIATSFGAAVLMDWFDKTYKAFYPAIVLTQTMPAVVVAPLLVLQFGYEMAPRIIFVAVTTFFPTTVGMLTGFGAADPDAVNLLKVMGAGRFQIFRYIELSGAMDQSFSSLRISASCVAVGAAISEWLDSFGGSGVYITRVKKAFSSDRIFTVISLISVISLILMRAVELLQKRRMPQENSRKRKQNGKTISGVYKRRD